VGIPAAHIDCSHGDNEKAMARDMLETLNEMAHEAKFQVNFGSPFLASPGLCIHEGRHRTNGERPQDLGTQQVQSELGR
jgi:hypothetical protein